MIGNAHYQTRCSWLTLPKLANYPRILLLVGLHGAVEVHFFSLDVVTAKKKHKQVVVPARDLVLDVRRLLIVQTLRKATDERQAVPHDARNGTFQHDAIATRETISDRSHLKAMRAIFDIEHVDVIGDRLIEGVDDVANLAVHFNLELPPLG